MPDRIAAHYRSLLKQHGDRAEAAQYSSRESQERRFEQLIRIGPLQGCRVLDFGCGTAHLATYLHERGIAVHYTGVDIVDEFLDVARNKHPGHRFGRFEQFESERFDYTFASGVFNNRRRDNRKFYQHWVRMLFEVCERGLAFNMMSAYVDYRDDGLFYEQPERAFRFVKRNVTPFVTLLHDYEVKPGVIPFEFVVQAHRKAVA